jgi:hypothetical protein
MWSPLTTLSDQRTYPYPASSSSHTAPRSAVLWWGVRHREGARRSTLGRQEPPYPGGNARDAPKSTVWLAGPSLFDARLSREVRTRSVERLAAF